VERPILRVRAASVTETPSSIRGRSIADSGVEERRNSHWRREGS
jgi:hypothetical protein